MRNERGRLSGEGVSQVSPSMYYACAEQEMMARMYMYVRVLTDGIINEALAGEDMRRFAVSVVEADN